MIRPGDERDEPAVLALLDGAVAWLVERGQTGQWGAASFSERPERRERVHEFAAGGGLHIAERGGEPVGALVAGDAPAYPPPAPTPELYIILVVSSRRLAGYGIVGELTCGATKLARDRGAGIVRVDCWRARPRSSAGMSGRDSPDLSCSS